MITNIDNFRLFHICVWLAAFGHYHPVALLYIVAAARTCPPLEKHQGGSKMHHSLHTQTPHVKEVRERRFEGGTDGFSRPASGAERDHVKSCKRPCYAVLLTKNRQFAQRIHDHT